MNFLLVPSVFLSIFFGLYFGLRVRNNPTQFWIYLVVGLIYTSPLMIGGYTWYDEFYAGAFILANLKLNFRKIIKNFYFYLSILFIFLMIIQGIRGVLFFANIGLVESVSKIRWIFFYILLLVIFLRVAPEKYINNNYNSDLAYVITKNGLIFTIIYTLIGLLAVLTSGSVAYTQYAQIDSSPGPHFFALFGATAYVVPLFIIFISASLFVIMTGDLKKSKVAFILLSLVFANQLFYGSRSGILIFLFFIFLYFIQNIKNFNYFKLLINLLPIILLIFLFQFYLNEQNLNIILEDLLNTLHIGDGRDDNLQDIDRRVWNFAAVSALLTNEFNFLFGWGLRTSGYIVSTHVYDLFMEARGFAILEQDVATPGFAALAVDGGVVVIIFVATMMFKAWKNIFDINRKSLLYLSLAPILMVLQLFIMNITDMLILWIAIIPGGLFYSFLGNIQISKNL